MFSVCSALVLAAIFVVAIVAFAHALTHAVLAFWLCLMLKQFSSVANSIIETAYIHILVFTVYKNNRFEQKLIVWNTNT